MYKIITFLEINLFKIEFLQPNTDVLELIDSSERLIKQLQGVVMFLREESRNKINTIKCTLDQLSKRDGTVCSDTERPSYRKSANDSIMLTNEKPIVIVKKLILTKKIF